MLPSSKKVLFFVVWGCVQCMSCALVMLKKRQEKRQKRQKKRQKECQQWEVNPGPDSSVPRHVPTRLRHVSAEIWLIGGIDSEHILVTGVTTQCLAEG